MNERSEVSRLERLVMCLEQAADHDDLSVISARGYLVDVAQFLSDIVSGNVCDDCKMRGKTVQPWNESACSQCVFWNAGMPDRYSDT